MSISALIRAIIAHGCDYRVIDGRLMVAELGGIIAPDSVLIEIASREQLLAWLGY